MVCERASRATRFEVTTRYQLVFLWATMVTRCGGCSPLVVPIMSLHHVLRCRRGLLHLLRRLPRQRSPVPSTSPSRHTSSTHWAAYKPWRALLLCNECFIFNLSLALLRRARIAVVRGELAVCVTRAAQGALVTRMSCFCSRVPTCHHIMFDSVQCGRDRRASRWSDC